VSKDKGCVESKAKFMCGSKGLPYFSKKPLRPPQGIPFQRRRQTYIAVLRRTAFASLIPTISLDEPTLNELFLVKLGLWPFKKYMKQQLSI